MAGEFDAGHLSTDTDHVESHNRLDRAVGRMPLAPSVYDDEFDDDTVDSKWSWVNQGSATITELDSVTLLAVPAVTGDNYRLRVQAAPSGDFTLTGRMQASVPSTMYIAWGLVLYNSGNGKFISWGLTCNSDPNLTMTRYNSATSFGSNTTGTSRWDTAPFWRITRASNTFSFLVSRDGYSWLPFTTETLSNHLSALTHIGFGGNSNNGSNALTLALHSFRVTEP